jgi:hypothetical protein
VNPVGSSGGSETDRIFNFGDNLKVVNKKIIDNFTRMLGKINK